MPAVTNQTSWISSPTRAVSLLTHIRRATILYSIVLAVWMHLIAPLESLRLTHVEVPPMVAMGQAFWLNCSYDLEDEELYSIKWYHWNPDSAVNGEFYRWLPSDSPPGQKFELKGIHLDLSRSSLGNVYMTKSDIYTNGTFRCEVSAEAPSFQTVRKEMELHIYSLPSEKATIKGNTSDISHYGPGDLVNLTCRSKPSRPSTSLSWYINDQLAEGRIVKTLPVPRRSDGRLESASQLTFHSERAHYRNGLLKVACVSNIVQPYTVTSEEIVIGGDAIKHSNSPHTVSESMNKDVPIITGLRSNYQVGDSINLTCISRAKHAPKLRFIVNDEEATRSRRIDQVYRLSDGLLASKLGLEFQVESDDASSQTSPRRAHRPHGQGSKSMPGVAGQTTLKQYRIKCAALMEKTIYTSKVEVHLGTSKQSSGLHLAGNFAVSLDDTPVCDGTEQIEVSDHLAGTVSRYSKLAPIGSGIVRSE